MRFAAAPRAPTISKLSSMRVLSIIHGENARSALFGEEVRSQGHELDERSFAFGEAPAEPERYDAVMVFGGAMNVHEVDGNPWLLPEQRALARVLELEVPVLGVCLGSQLLAAVAGGTVSRAPEPEIGWYEVELTAEGTEDPVLGAFPARFTSYQWHSYQFSRPPGSVVLATSPNCLQAFRLGNHAWGTQFHAEVTEEIVGNWISSYGTDPDAVRIGFDPERERRRLATEIGPWNDLGRKLIRGFLGVAADRVGLTPQHARA
jgi:GMP synthase (glutamine-hydrolysing)